MAGFTRFPRLCRTGKQGLEGASWRSRRPGNQIGGRRVVLIAEDDEAKPDVALAKAKKLVERDRVQALMGVIWSPNAMALRGYVHEQKVPLVLSEVAGARPITQEAGSPMSSAPRSPAGR